MAEWHYVPKVSIYLFIFPVVALKFSHIDFTGSHNIPVASSPDKIICTPYDCVGVLSESSEDTLYHRCNILS